jgi:Bacteriophage HK97-gp10, putative tail-component
MATNQSLERFKKLTDELKRECLTIAKTEIAAQAERLVQVMKAACPVNADPPPEPGLLRDSIGWTFGEPPSVHPRATGVFRPKTKKTKSGSQSEFIANVYAGSTKAFYARWVEFGTQAHSLGKGGDISRGKRQQGVRQHPGSPAQPFFWPSYRLLRKSMRSTVKRRLTKAIKQRSAAA